MNELIPLLIGSLQTLPNEVVGAFIYLTTIGSLFLLQRLFGKEGLFVFIVLAVIIANIQSLKVIQLSFFDAPIAMGSILFTTTLLATDILSEYYGKKETEKAIWLGFFGLLMVSVMMLLTLGTQVIPAQPGSSLYRYVETHDAMTLLFTPSSALTLASLIAYLISQYTDMWVFLWLKKRSNSRFLSIRTFLATLLATLVDNCIFSFLAWRVFYPLDIDLKTFFYAYILGALGIRIFVNLLNSPFIYYVRKQNQKQQHPHSQTMIRSTL
ncbi:MAG TPA: queuosine precursor transporter [Gammaproteobacteria bacterium]|nr:queuosine precursor transporter [Gammaproteobacteria bacterium]